jgi:hypothetical protein
VLTAFVADRFVVYVPSVVKGLYPFFLATAVGVQSSVFRARISVTCDLLHGTISKILQLIEVISFKSVMRNRFLENCVLSADRTV